MDEQQNFGSKTHECCQMHPKMKFIKLLALIFIIAVVAIWFIADTSNKINQGRYIGQDAQYKNTVAISAEGKVLAKPDIGQVDLTVFTQKSAVSPAQTENTQKMNAIIEALKILGIKDEDLKTVNYQINPNYQYTTGRSVIIGYEVRQTLEVKIRDLSQTAAILDKAATLGANEIGSLSFTIDDQEKLKTEARDQAIASAKAKAQTLANILGVKLGQVANFTESSAVPYPVYYNTSEKLGIGGGGVAPDVQTGQNEITVNVVLTYEIY